MAGGARGFAPGIGLDVEARLLLAGLLARRARARRDWTACVGHVRAALRLVGPAAGLGTVEGCAPARHARGGFFAVVTEGDGGRRFVKGVPARGREALFWAAWQRGSVVTEGRHYRLVPPVAVVAGRLIAVLVFPALPGLEAPRERRQRLYRRHALRVARALAEFNAAHPDPDWFPPAASPGPVPVPRRRAVERALGVDRVAAAGIVEALAGVEAGWGRVLGPVRAGERCLCHMDLGMDNALVGEPAVLIDFAHAGSAPVGADLHTLMRYVGAAGPDTEALVEAYVEVFAARGVTLEAAEVRRNLRAHFAARYRDLRFASARNHATFGTALALSQELVAAADVPG
jgi:hypothetical protein